MSAGGSSRRGSSPWAAAVPTVTVRRHSAGSSRALRVAEWAVGGLLVLTIWALVAAATGAGVTDASTSSAAALGLSPASAVTNATVGAGGSGFAGRTLVQLTWDGNPAGMPSVQTAGNGSFKTQFVVPQAAAGTTHAIGATAQASTGGNGNGKKPGGAPASASAVFTVLSLISLASPTPAATASASPTPTTAPTAAPTTAPTATPAVTATPTTAPTAAPTLTPAPTVTPVTTTSPTTTPGPSAAPSSTPAPTATPQSSGFVARSGTKLTLSGQPYAFTGLNIYNANSRNNCWYSMGNNDSVLDNSLTQIGGGQNVFRAWFYQSLATTRGVRDWSAFDHTLAVAASRGERVIVALADQWGSCEESTPVYKDELWYGSGYKTMVRSGTVPYRNYVAEVVTRYRNNPTVLFWQLMNEAEDNPGKDIPCAATGASTLKAWATDMAAMVKSVDPNHLLSIGTGGGGQCGASYTEYKDLHGIADVDVCEYHDYSPPSVTMPGDQWNGLAFRIQQCNELNKPIFIGEMGMQTSDAGSLSARASAFDAKSATQFTAGVAGILFWAWNNASTYPLNPYDIGPTDPALAVLTKY
jgi:mannan endo-1,4-beta-mannosidase